MKLIKIVGHPVLVMCFFLLLLISGEGFGGFYLIYLLIGLPHGVPHALLALAGLGAMFTGYKIYRKQSHVIKPLLYLLGSGLMVSALVAFFTASKGYNDPTFHQAVPLVTFILFGVCVASNAWLSVGLLLGKQENQNDTTLNIVP